MAKSNQVIFLKGKEKALKSLFNDSNFGYLAIGFDETDEGFEDLQDGDITTEGFKELSPESYNYSRIKLDVLSSEPDYDTGRVLVKFKAELPDYNINGTPINQMAIVDNQEVNAAETTYFSATTFPSFNKTNNSSITFVIGLKL